MHGSSMSKRITIDDDVYRLLSALKQGGGDSFTTVLRRHLHKRANTAAQLLDAYDNEPPPQAKPLVLKRLLKERGQRIGVRK